MQPKIGYLIDENTSWDEDPNWKFYAEKDVKDVPEHILLSRWRLDEKVKRIVYWEV
jgi:hypothetical protein